MKKQTKKKLLAAKTTEVAATKTEVAAADSRRSFLRNGLLAAAGFYIVPRNVLGRGFTAPSDKLQIAGIGAGGKGESDLYNFFMSGKADIVALADVDSRQTEKSRASIQRPMSMKISEKCWTKKKVELTPFLCLLQTIHTQ